MEKPHAILYYDGDCPICTHYRNYVELRKHIDLELRNAREYVDELEGWKRNDIDINRGMILIVGNDVYHRDEVVIWLSSHMQPRGSIDSVVQAISTKRSLMRFLYPLLKFCRDLLLWLTRKDRNVLK